MSKKVRVAIFKLIDILVIFTMVSASPMSMLSAAALAQDSSAALVTDKADYAPGESAHVTGSGFAAGDYVLAAQGPDGQADWGTVSADANGGFETDSPALGSEGSYEVRAYASVWNGDWEETPVASATFTVTAPPDPTATPTEEPTEEPTATDVPTETPTEEPTATEVPTDVRLTWDLAVPQCCYCDAGTPVTTVYLGTSENPRTWTGVEGGASLILSPRSSSRVAPRSRRRGISLSV